MTPQQKHLIVGTALGYILSGESKTICFAVMHAKVKYLSRVSSAMVDLGIDKYKPFELYMDRLWFPLNETGRKQRIDLLRKVLKDIEKELQDGD